MDIGFFRRWYGNFQVVDNLALSPADFSYFDYKLPLDPRLPGGGGNTVTGFASIKPTVGGFGFPTPGTGYAANQNVIKLSDDIGNQIEHWNGVDVNFNARLANGFFAQGGFSTGRTRTNKCDIVSKLPETLFEGQNFFSPYFLTNLPASFCKQDGVFITQVKALASYTIPKADVQVSATYQNLPGVPITAAANLNGLVPIAGLQFIFPSFHIVEPGTLYGERLNQIDLRVAKIFRIGRTRVNFIFDVYNLFNADTITGQDNTYTPVPGGQAIWQVPNLILQARFIKIGMNIDF
jgi:hypothetical protein